MIKKIVSQLNTLLQYPELLKATAQNRGLLKDLLYIKQNFLFTPDIIIDVGAAIGEWSKAAQFTYPSAKIFSFEPILESHKKVKEMADNNSQWTSYQYALSNYNGSSSFHLNDFSFSSSLLEMTEKHKEEFPFTKNEKIIPVEVRRLDEIEKVAATPGSIFMKIDTQGSELQVLEGAIETLKRTQILFLEVNFEELYKGQATYLELMTFLYDHNFKAFIQRNPHFSNDGQSLLWSDVIFLNIL